MALPRGFRFHLSFGEVGIAFSQFRVGQNIIPHVRDGFWPQGQNETGETRQNDFVGLVPLRLARPFPVGRASGDSRFQEIFYSPIFAEF